MRILSSILFSWGPILFWFLPALFVLFPQRINRLDKVLWFVATLLTSWIGVLFFFVYLKITPGEEHGAHG